MKLQLYTASEIPQPAAPASADPYDTSGRAYAQAAHSIRSVPGELAPLSHTLLAMDQQKKEAEAAVEAIQGRVDLAQQLSDADIRRRQSKEFDASTHDAWLRSEGDLIMSNIAKGMKSQQSADAFKKAGTTLIGEKSITAKYEYAQQLEKQMSAGHYALGQQLESEAINGPEVMVGVAVDQYNRAGLALIGKAPGYDALSVAKMTKEFSEKIWSQRVHREAEADPEGVKKRLAEKNQDGGWKNYPGLSEEARTKGFDFAKVMAHEAAVEERRITAENEAKIKAEALEDRKNLMSGLTSWAFGYVIPPGKTGKMTETDLAGVVSQFRLEPHEQRELRNIILEPPREGPSDPTIKATFQNDVYRMSPKTTHEMLDRANAAFRAGRPGLNNDDYKEYKRDLTATQRFWYGQGQEQAKYNYSKALEAADLKLGGSVETYDPERAEKYNAVKGEFHQEVWRRSGPGQGKENPQSVINSLMPKYQRMLRDTTEEDRDRTLGLLGLPKGAAKPQIDEMIRLHKSAEPSNRSGDEWRRWADKAKRFRDLERIDMDLNRTNTTIQQQEQDQRATQPGRVGSGRRPGL